MIDDWLIEIGFWKWKSENVVKNFTNPGLVGLWTTQPWLVCWWQGYISASNVEIYYMTMCAKHYGWRVLAKKCRHRLFLRSRWLCFMPSGTFTQTILYTRLDCAAVLVNHSLAKFCRWSPLSQTGKFHQWLALSENTGWMRVIFKMKPSG